MPQYIVKEHTREVCISVPLSANAVPLSQRGTWGCNARESKYLQATPGEPLQSAYTYFGSPVMWHARRLLQSRFETLGGCPPYLSLTKAKNRSLPRTVFGADRRIRTADLVITNDVLCQLSYISKQAKNAFL